jgi:hypothetical protein
MWIHSSHPPHTGFAHLYLSLRYMVSSEGRGETDRIAIHYLPLFESPGCSNEDLNRHWIHTHTNPFPTGIRMSSSPPSLILPVLPTSFSPHTK